MNIRFDDNLKKRCLRSGSVLVMVVVLTVLLALIGVLFVVMARMDNMSASGVANNADLHAGVEAVVDQIKSVMVKDLYGTATVGSGRLTVIEMEDSSANDLWLASLEPEPTYAGTGDESDDLYRWPFISDVYGIRFDLLGSFGYLEDIADPTSVVSRTGVKAKIILPNAVITPTAPAANPAFATPNGASADADGDGVSDSRWVVIPGMRSSKGKDVYAAVRVIDNCAMLNLNTAHTKDSSTDPNDFPDDSGYLSAVDYERFLRGSDTNGDGVIDSPIPPAVDNIRVARNRSGLVGTAKDHHDNVVMHIENPDAYIVPPNPGYSLFDIGDELEIRNRYMLTSKVESRFERVDIANYTLDAGGGLYVTLKIPRTYGNDSDGIPLFTKWKWRVNPLNFDGASGGIVTEAWKYDRRHVCTFYSFDRNLRKRDYPLVDVTGVITGTPWTIGVTPLNIKDYSLLTPIITPAITPAEILSTFDQDVFIPPNAPVDLKEDFYSNTLQSRKNILHLLYAFRAYYIDNDPTGATGQAIVADAARRAAQYVANMIDYIDDTNPTTQGPFYDSGPPPIYDYGGQTNDDPTYINRDIIRELILEVSEDSLGAGNGIDIDLPLPIGSNLYEFGLGVDDPTETVYGYERQPFIAEISSTISGNDTIGYTVSYFAIELCNPYDTPIPLVGWQVVVGGDPYNLTVNVEVSSGVPGLGYTAINVDSLTHTGMENSIASGGTVKLQRPDPATGLFITVDETKVEQTTHLLTSTADTYASKREDTGWKFIDSSKFTKDTAPNINAANNINPPLVAKGYQLPVANTDNHWSSLRDLESVTFLGNGGGGPNGTITQQIATVADEGDVRFDIKTDPLIDSLLEYISLINRPNGRLPGRINVNTATMEVIRAAIPENVPTIDADALAANIISGRPYSEIGDLLAVAGFNIPDNVGDREIVGDFEERDWILSRLANIFTVRSDTFTAYILVRLGTDGPQKRMIAILDRTGVFSPGDRPRLVALHPVPDPR